MNTLENSKETIKKYDVRTIIDEQNDPFLPTYFLHINTYSMIHKTIKTRYQFEINFSILNESIRHFSSLMMSMMITMIIGSSIMMLTIISLILLMVICIIITTYFTLCLLCIRSFFYS